MGWQAELFWAKSLESGVAGWRVPPAPDLRPTPRGGPASGGDRAGLEGQAAASGSSWGRSGPGVEGGAASEHQKVVREAGRARASADRDGLSRAGGRAGRSCPRRVPRPRPGSRHRLTRSPPTASDPAAAPGRCPAAGGGAAPLA